MNQLQSMRVFVKVADLGSFVGAAGALDLSTAVVTRHVADLEARLGTRLLNRTTRRLSLTESGRTYLERVRPILDDLEGVEQMVVARNHEPVGTLRIVAPVVFGLHSLAPVVQSYAQRYPDVVPDVTLADRNVDLVDEGFDVGIMVARQMRSASIVTRRLTTGYMTVCATPAYLEQHGTPVHPEDLLTHPCLSRPAEQGGDEKVFTGPQGEVRVRPTNAIAANNTEMLRQFALLGMGVAILPSYLIGRDLASGRLVPLLGDYRLPQIEITIAYPSRLHLPAKVRTFIDHLVAHFQQTDEHTRDPRAALPRRVVSSSPVYADDLPVSALPGDTARPKRPTSRGGIAAASSL
ncbi:LysR family transcriptional regulator [Paraburkholderia fungorum]|jgi:DNA-binding transcriptional LysR family regulator|uniref:Bacterial regulatory helix-turn-helix, lysR family protein n=1 Tax=Paraburkholderia fungorum TaxID=134537 RepID=A0AAP5QFS6_9BURK|nr:LysR family transcriptional regulator [Paraburkholderia fungorum]KFX61403.1 LysR family transcriptional regulator [Burkholderia sp. K24]AJZ58416.1 bacterial regulatory helix-turn-helix, lysR family protein [Paraburkholderia fungorum]MBB4514766.1 DNA-binding transcriptional LysR family regulator [Paraburkholderia fungorum]MBB6202710.1 DNA-binding transcriptional LysR family regulator [Paraburkholderia fungorum]MBU7436539.1 LysR family transcriptional regulator [Paraburkholderia fungorum]